MSHEPCLSDIGGPVASFLAQWTAQAQESTHRPMNAKSLSAVTRCALGLATFAIPDDSGDFIQDLGHLDGETLLVYSTVTKAWRIKNTGDVP